MNRSSACGLPGLWSGCRLPGQLPVRLLDLVRGGGLVHAEDGVEVLLQPVLGTHRSTPSRRVAVARPPARAGRDDPVTSCTIPDRRPRPAPAAAAARRAGSRAASRRRRSARSTSAEVWCATASCRVGSNGSPFSPKRGQAELAQRGGELLGHRAERPDQVAVLAGPVEVVEDRQQRGQHRAGGLLRDQRPGPGRPACGSWRTPPSPAAGPGSARRARTAAPPARRRAPAPAAAAVSTGSAGASTTGGAGRLPDRRRRSTSASISSTVGLGRRSTGRSAGTSPRRRRRARWLRRVGELAVVPDDDPLGLAVAGPWRGATRRRPGGVRVGGSWLLRHAATSIRCRGWNARRRRSLLVVLVDDLRVDHVVAAPRRPGGTGTGSAPGRPDRPSPPGCSPCSACCA